MWTDVSSELSTCEWPLEKPPWQSMRHNPCNNVHRNCASADSVLMHMVIWICGIVVNFTVKMFLVPCTFHQFFTMKWLVFFASCQKFTAMFHMLFECLNDQCSSHDVVLLFHIIWGVSNISATWKRSVHRMSDWIGLFACLYIRRRNKTLRHRIKVWWVKPPDPRLKNVRKSVKGAETYDLVHPSPWSVSINQSSSCSSRGMLPSEEAGKKEMLKRKLNIWKLPSNV